MVVTLVKKYITVIKRIFWIFNKPKIYIFSLLFCFLGLGALDLLGISLIGPFVLLFFDFERLQNDWGLFRNIDKNTLSILASILIVSIFLTRSVLIWILNRYILKTVYDRQISVRVNLLEHILRQDYSSRVKKTTAEYITQANQFCSAFTSQTLNIFRISTETITILLITLLLIFTDFKLFLVGLVFVIIAISTLVFIFSRKFVEFGRKKNKGNILFNNAIQESVSGIKDVKIFGLSKFFGSKMHIGASIVAEADKRLYLFSIVPRYIVETLVVMIICMIMLVSSFTTDDPVSTISKLSVFLVAALRLLPSISLIISASNAFNLNMDSVNRLYKELQIVSQEEVSAQKISKQDNKSQSFEKFQKIDVANLSFSYDPNKVIFDNISFVVNQGDFIGLVGGSGEGKTTLIDLMLGINIPSGGDIMVNDVSIYSNIFKWRERIAYLPQETFIIQGSLAENIALGQDTHEIDDQKILDSLEKAGLSKFLDGLDNGIYTHIGERGLSFSGGQRQRISLARAFYSDRDVFLLDESTSALDSESAERILEFVQKLTKSGSTAILISHNESNLSFCNRKLRIKNRKVEEI